jgi:oxygen-dependent protoporphyrinogen oxidase
MAEGRIAIVGGGITGLSAAYELTKAGLRPTLIDAQPQLGGVIQTDRVEGCVLEGGPDSFLSAKPEAAQLIRELGLGSDLIGSNDHSRVTYLVRGGRLIPLPDGLLMMVPTRIMPVAASPLLSWGTKIRMGLEFFRKPPASKLADRSVEQFIAEHYGQEAVDYLAEPLLSGVYGGSVKELSVDSVLTRFVELESKYGSLTRGVLEARKKSPKREGAEAPLFQTLKGGLAQLTGELEARVRPAADVLTARVSAVEPAERGYRLRVGEDWMEARQVVFACPAWAAGSLMRPFNEGVADRLESIPYSSSLTLAIGFHREQCGPIPAGFGFLVPARERGSLVACTFVGAKFPFRVPDSHVVLRCFLGGWGNEAALELTQEELLERVGSELRRLLGWWREPAFVRVSRWPRSMAQYTVGHSQRITEIESLLRNIPGVHVAGNGYTGIGISDCVRTGRAAARAAASFA